MQSIRKFACFFSLVAATLFLTACPSQTTISKINGDPGRYRDKEVAVAGRVTDSYGVMGTGAYEVDDGTGRIWVAATRGVPARGSRVGVKGRVHGGLTISGRTFGTIIEETDRRVQTR
ncbi:MAG: nucleic acid binding, OB-fold, tRNA/helicase-type [Acidobacteria bacterium]|nr:nucleic acid binding, OB-fold, tRNA/helicase-type [Acidobacteriota bacterium]